MDNRFRIVRYIEEFDIKVETDYRSLGKAKRYYRKLYDKTVKALATLEEILIPSCYYTINEATKYVGNMNEHIEFLGYIDYELDQMTEEFKSDILASKISKNKILVVKCFECEGKGWNLKDNEDVGYDCKCCCDKCGGSGEMKLEISREEENDQNTNYRVTKNIY